MSLKRRLNSSNSKVKPRITNTNITVKPFVVKDVKPIIATTDTVSKPIVINNFQPTFIKSDLKLRRQKQNLNRIDIIKQRFEINFPIIELFKGTPASQLKVPYTNNLQPEDTEIFTINEPLNGKIYLPRYKIKSHKVSDKQQLLIKLTESTDGEGGSLNIQLQTIAPPEIAAVATGMSPADINPIFEISYTLPNSGLVITEQFTEKIKTEDGYDITARISSTFKYNQLVAAMLDGIYGCQLVIKREFSFGIPVKVTPSNNDLNINPQLYFTGKESSTINGNVFTRINLSIKNWESFSNDLFKASPSLPPCGLNTNSSRTWLDIFDGAGKRLYGYCAFNTNENLRSFSFAISANQTLPLKVYITLNDRELNKTYTSNIISLQANPIPLTEEVHQKLYTITVKEFIQEEPFHLPELLYQYIYGNTSRTIVNEGGFIQHNVVFSRMEHIYLQDVSNPYSFYYLPERFILSSINYPPFSPNFKVKLVGKTIDDISAYISYEADAYTDPERIIDAFDKLQKTTGLENDKIKFSPLSISGDKLLYKLSVPGEIGYKERNESLLTLNNIKDSLQPISLPLFQDLFDNLTTAQTTSMLMGHIEVTILGRSQPAIVPVSIKLTDIYNEVFLIEQGKTPIIHIGIQNNSDNTLQAQGLVAEIQNGENILSCSKANLQLPLILNPGEKTEFILIPKGLVEKTNNIKVVLNWEGIHDQQGFQIYREYYDSADFIQATNGSVSTLQLDNITGTLTLPEREIPLNIKKIYTPNLIESGTKISFLAFLSEEVDSYNPEDFIFRWEGLKIIPDKDKLFETIVDTSIGANYELNVKISLFIKFKTETTSIRLLKVEFKNEIDGPLINTVMFNDTDQINEVSGTIEKEAVLMMPIKNYVLGSPNSGEYFYRITLIKETDTLGNTQISESQWQSKSGSLEITTNQLPI